MKLTILERVLLLGILPREGNIVTVNNSQNVTNLVKFSPEEMDSLGIVQNDKGMQWNAEAAEAIGDKEVAIGVSGAELVKTTLKKLSDEEKLPRDALSLYKKFVDGNLTVRDDKGKIVRDEVPEVITTEEVQEMKRELEKSMINGLARSEQDKVD